MNRRAAGARPSRRGLEISRFLEPGRLAQGPEALLSSADGSVHIFYWSLPFHFLYRSGMSGVAFRGVGFRRVAFREMPLGRVAFREMPLGGRGGSGQKSPDPPPDRVVKKIIRL